MAEWWQDANRNERCQFIASLKLAGAIEPQRDTLGDRAVDAILSALYAAPSRLTIAPLQDLFGWKERVNTPGTVDAINWKWRLPFALDRLPDNSELSARIAALHAIASRTRRI